MLKKILFASLMMLLLASASALAAEKGAGGPPPSPVVTAKVTTGNVAPSVEYIGTVYFNEQSDVASEVAGLAVSVDIEYGTRVKKGDVLVRLSSEFLDKDITGARALLSQYQANYDTSRLESERVTRLFNAKSVAEGEYDTKRLTALAAKNKVVAQEAVLEGLLLERVKKTIRAPYDGVVLDKPISRGEWISKGATVAVIGRDDEFDVLVNVPSSAARVAKPGLKVRVYCEGAEMDGELYAVVPKGDVSSRSFPVRIRVKNPGGLAEGMEARVTLAAGMASNTIVVPRDAVISARGNMVVWAVLDGKAVPIPVIVVGYRGLEAGVVSDKLKPGMDVVVKGNERLRPGQAVAPQK